jgi:uncharacterized protein involved in exopolysaccharide biosynthesis
MLEDEIDLRQYIDVLRRRWKLIASVTAVAVIAAAVVSLLLPPVYEAKAGVVSVQSRSELTFEPRYQTVEGELQRQDVQARRQALLALVKSSSVAAEVIAQLGDALEPEERQVAAMLKKVEAGSEGDLINIKVNGRNRGTIVAVANAWGEAFEMYVNELYGTMPQSLGNVQAQREDAWQAYQEAQEALVAFRGDNQIEHLTNEIQAKQGTLSDYYVVKRQLDRLMANAEALREQLRSGGSVPGVADALPVLLLRANAFTLLPGDLPAELQLSLEQATGSDVGREEQAEELDTLIAVLQARRDEVQALIDEGSLQREVLQLQEQLEQEEARQWNLDEARNLARETYQALARKEDEARIATGVRDTEVRFAVPAVEPREPVSPKKRLNAAVAGALGLMVGIFAVFFIEFMEGEERGDTEQ